MISAACGSTSQPTITPPTPADPVSPAFGAGGNPCADTAIRFEVTPPRAGAPSATFAFSWQGEGHGSAAKTVCLVRGTEVERVPRGERREVAINADAHKLQRIVVGTRSHLIAVPPGATITLGDNPCFFYELSGPNTDAWFVPAPIAYCSRKNEDCRTGFFRPSPPRPVHDEMCGDTEVIRRCVAEAEIRLAGTPQPVSARNDAADDTISIAQLAGGAPVRLAPRTCGFSMLDTGHEVVALVVGAGERWSLTIDAGGTLTGELVH